MSYISTKKPIIKTTRIFMEITKTSLELRNLKIKSLAIYSN